jgi:hypothetical protein
VGEVKVEAGVVEKKAVGSAALVLNGNEGENVMLYDVAVVGAAVADEDVVDGMRIMLDDVVAVTVLDEVGTVVLVLGDGVLLLLVVDANVVADPVLEEPATGCEVVVDVGAGELDDSTGLLVVVLLLIADADVVTVVVLEDNSPGSGVVLVVLNGVLDESAVVLDDATAVLLLLIDDVDVPPPLLNSEHGSPFSSGPEYPLLQIQFEILLLPGPENECKGQARHPVAAAPAKYVPGAQSVHRSLPFTSLYVPAAHASHSPPSGPEYPSMQVQFEI